jgi:hypothetical protein
MIISSFGIRKILRRRSECLHHHWRRENVTNDEAPTDRVVSAWLAVAVATVFCEYAAMHSILVLTLLSLFFQQHGQRFLFIIGTLYPTVSTTTKPIPPSPKPYVKYERICLTDRFHRQYSEEEVLFRRRGRALVAAL